MPIEIPSSNQIQTPAPTTEGNLATGSDTVETTPLVRDADAAGTATDDLLLAQTLRDCITSLPQSSLLSPPPELNDDSERSRSSTPDQADAADVAEEEQESEVVQMAKLLRRSLYIMAGLGDPSGVYQNSSSENNTSFAIGNDVTEILRDSLYAVTAMQTIRDQQRALQVEDSPDLESWSNLNPSANPNSSLNPNPSSNPNPTSTPNPQTTALVALNRLMSSPSGPPWGNDVMKSLCEALYTEPFDETRTSYLFCVAASFNVIAYCDEAVKTSDDYINRIRCLVGFLEQSKGNGTMSEFLDLARAQVPGWALGEKEYINARYILWTLFHWPMWVADNGATFRDKIDAIFPPLRKRRQSPSFSVTLSDIFVAGLEVVPTTFIQEHLLVTDNVVKILRLTMDDMRPLERFSTNRAAIALQIGSLGVEIFSSLYELYGRKKEFERARSLRLLRNDNQEDDELSLQLMFDLYAVNNKTKPQVLASRVLALNSLVRHRQSWMVSLIRDMKASKREQPFLFWGSVVAFLFGICTVIQTVVSVWSLQLALVAS
ncbi:hypothetical protein B0H14DRAFT_2936833 [Mycena olivaceomarginata]|nr:hypothetical protein B0H14DRAFT_2936833 [Mycena olivaceomarginata]